MSESLFEATAASSATAAPSSPLFTADPNPEPVYERVRGLGIQGQWLAMIGASVLVCFTYMIVVLRLDWTEKALGIHLRELRERAEEAMLAAQLAAASEDAAPVSDETVTGGGLSGEEEDAAVDKATGDAEVRPAVPANPRARLLVAGDDSATQYGSY